MPLRDDRGTVEAADVVAPSPTHFAQLLGSGLQTSERRRERLRVLGCDGESGPGIAHQFGGLAPRGHDCGPARGRISKSFVGSAPAKIGRSRNGTTPASAEP